MNTSRNTTCDALDEQGERKSLLLIVDEEVAAYIDQSGIEDVNAYVNALLEKANRKSAAAASSRPDAATPKKKAETLISQAPDTSVSGY